MNFPPLCCVAKIVPYLKLIDNKCNWGIEAWTHWTEGVYVFKLHSQRWKKGESDNVEDAHFTEEEMKREQTWQRGEQKQKQQNKRSADKVAQREQKAKDKNPILLSI